MPPAGTSAQRRPGAIAKAQDANYAAKRGTSHRVLHLLDLTVMELQMLEARVGAIVEAVIAGRQVEDDRIELKALWPSANHDVARRIAGHANAAGGESILWVIGLDERRRRIGSTSGVEPANWWNAVRKHFDGPSPEPTWLRVLVSGNADVMALQFTTERAPYVVNVAKPGQVHREVPWRSSTSSVAVSGPGELRLRGEHVLDPGEGDPLLRARKIDLNLQLPIDASARASRLDSRLSVEPPREFSERDIPDQHDEWHLARRFTVGSAPQWWS